MNTEMNIAAVASGHDADAVVDSCLTAARILCNSAERACQRDEPVRPEAIFCADTSIAVLRLISLFQATRDALTTAGEVVADQAEAIKRKDALLHDQADQLNRHAVIECQQDEILHSVEASADALRVERDRLRRRVYVLEAYKPEAEELRADLEKAISALTAARLERDLERKAREDAESKLRAMENRILALLARLPK